MLGVGAFVLLSLVAPPAAAQEGFWDVRVETRKLCPGKPGEGRRYEPDPGILVTFGRGDTPPLSATTVQVDAQTAVATLRLPRITPYLMEVSSPARPAARAESLTHNGRLGVYNLGSNIQFYESDANQTIVVTLIDGDCVDACKSGQQAVNEFRENLLPVLRHPRCANCHGAMDIFATSTSHPGGGFAGREEELIDQNWVPCAECHDRSPKNKESSTEEAQWRVMLTDSARWALLSDRALCVRLKETAQIAYDFLAHVRDDFRVRLGFEGTRGHKDLDAEPPPRTKWDFFRSAERWVNAMGEGAWSKPDCGCEGLSDTPPPKLAASTDCKTAVGQVQDALTAEAGVLADSLRTACQFKSLPPQSRSGRAEAINDTAQQMYAAARQKTAAAYKAAESCDTSGLKRLEVGRGRRDSNAFTICYGNKRWKAATLPVLMAGMEASTAQAAWDECSSLLDEIDCETIKVLQDKPPVIEDSGITVPDSVKPECREAYRQLKTAEREAEKAQKYLQDLSGNLGSAGPRGSEMVKSVRASLDRARAERDRAQAELGACEAKGTGQAGPSGAAISQPPGAQAKAWEPETVRDGPPIDVIPMGKADPAECKAICQQYSGCKAFVYVDPAATSDGTPLCQIKSGAGPARRDSCCVSGLP